MAKQQNKSVTRAGKPVNGMSSQTFVKGYKGQAQMNTNTISGTNLSSRGSKIMRSVYEAFGKR